MRRLHSIPHLTLIHRARAAGSLLDDVHECLDGPAHVVIAVLRSHGRVPTARCCLRSATRAARTHACCEAGTSSGSGCTESRHEDCVAV